MTCVKAMRNRLFWEFLKKWSFLNELCFSVWTGSADSVHHFPTLLSGRSERGHRKMDKSSLHQSYIEKRRNSKKQKQAPPCMLLHACLHLSPVLLFIYLLLSPTLLLTPPITASPHLNRLHSSLSFYTSFFKSLLTSQRESRDAECRNHKSGTVWNRRWLPWTAERFFITGAFLVPFTASTTCHQTQAVLCVYERLFGTWKWKRGTELQEVEMTRLRHVGNINIVGRNLRQFWRCSARELAWSSLEGFNDRVPTNKHNKDMTPSSGVWLAEEQAHSLNSTHLMWCQMVPSIQSWPPEDGNVIRFQEKPEHGSMIKFSRTAAV